MKIKFIINPRAGKGDLQRIKQELGKFCKDVWQKKQIETSISFTTAQGPSCAKKLAKKALLNRFNRIIFVGGDGLIYEGVNGIMEAGKENSVSDFAIGIVPTGTGNNFAKGLGIPQNIREALNVIKENQIIPVDIGRVNEKFFVNVISFGFDVRVADFFQRFKNKLYFCPKEVTYLLGALKEIFSNPHFPVVKLETEEASLEGEVLLVAVANSHCYGSIFKIAPGAEMGDGKMDICWIEKIGRLKTLVNLYRAIQGTHVKLPEVKMLRASSFKISSPEKLCCEMDGEVMKPEKEYKINTLASALKVLVPNQKIYVRKS